MKISLLRNSGNVAMESLERKVSYGELIRKAAAASAMFSKALGEFSAPQKLEDTKKIAIFSENTMEWVMALYGVWQTKAAAVPIDAKSSEEELEFILTDAECDIVCTSRDNLEKTKKVAANLIKAPQIFVLEEMFETKNLQEQTIPALEEIARELSELGLVVYTSGTTGNPKGVMLTFENMYANMQAVAEAKYYEDGVRVLIMLPFHHILPIMGTLVMPLYISGKMVFPKSISPADIAEVLQKYPVDMVVSVPRFYELMHANIMAKISASKLATILFNIAKLFNSLKISRKIFAAIHKKFGGEVKFWISGGAALDKKVWRELDVLGFGIREGFGMTECAPIITFPRIDRTRVGSPGEALPGIEIRIVDGEIAVRGKNITVGYYKRPQETAETIRNGWLFTGDLGYLDEQGFLFITGRRKEIIVLPNGKNLNPAEMETQIKNFSKDVLECGVLMYENMLQSIIRVSPDFIAAHPDDAEEFVRNNVILPYNRSTAMYKRIIRFVLTTEELPRTRVGKLKRYHLAAYLENISSMKPKSQTMSEPDSEVYRELKKVLAGQVTMPVSADSHMEMDLGLDSLGKISMQCYVRENFGVEVSERDFEKYSTLRDFAKRIEDSRDENFEPSQKNVTWSDIVNQTPYPKILKPQFFHFLTVDFFRLLLKLMYKVKISGLENAPENAALIIAPNHQSYVDGLFVASGFSKTQIYKTHFFAKTRSIIKDGIIKTFARRSNVLIMDINDNVSQSLQELAQVLRQGERVIIFPEGTRTKDGKVAEFKQSFAILSKTMNVPVVPVAIRGAYEALKGGATFPNFKAEICVDFLPPMTAAEDESYEDFSARVRAVIEQKCTEPTA